MRNWFTCKVKYFTQDELGAPKGVTEPYLVDAVSYTEAEARIYEALEGVIHGDHEVIILQKVITVMYLIMRIQQLGTNVKFNMFLLMKKQKKNEKLLIKF